jgi:hypothetical protein
MEILGIQNITNNLYISTFDAVWRMLNKELKETVNWDVVKSRRTESKTESRHTFHSTVCLIGAPLEQGC